jgi:hypothetical protein
VPALCGWARLGAGIGADDRLADYPLVVTRAVAVLCERRGRTMTNKTWKEKAEMYERLWKKAQSEADKWHKFIDLLREDLDKSYADKGDD